MKLNKLLTLAVLLASTAHADGHGPVRTNAQLYRPITSTTVGNTETPTKTWTFRDATDWHPEKADIIFHGGGGKRILVIHADGRITADPSAKPDEAAKAVLAALERMIKVCK